MKLTNYLIIICLCFISRANPSIARSNSAELNGLINLELRHGVGRYLDGKPIYQNLFLDLKCHNNQCEKNIYGWSPKYNQDVEHEGNIQVINQGSYWLLKVNLAVRPSPFSLDYQPANYDIELVSTANDKLIGSYRGKLNNDLNLGGKVTVKIEPELLVKIPNHQPIKSQEHPRLAFRKEDLSRLRNNAQTDLGKKILERLNDSLNEEISYGWYHPNGGYHASGHCFLAWLNDDAKKAQKGWEITQKAITLTRGIKDLEKPRVLEQSKLVTGVALAYDLCYPFWDNDQRKSLTQWLAIQAVELAQGGGEGWNNSTISNWNVRVRSASGMASLAIINEPAEFFPDHEFFFPYNRGDLVLATAERNILRYLANAIGDGGFGTEGDNYTYDSAQVMLPFLQAYENVLGVDMVTNTHARQLLPNNMMRLVKHNDMVTMPNYGRGQKIAGGGMYALAFATLPPELRGGARRIFDDYFTSAGDFSYGVDLESPYQAIYALAGYPFDVTPQHPQEILPSVWVDKIRGLYVFRNGWQNDQDIVASIYLKENPQPEGWNFPEVGSFRLTGFGHNFAVKGADDGNQSSQNMVSLSDTPWVRGQITNFVEREDGSGVVSLVTAKKTKTGEARLLRSFGVDYSKVSGADAVVAIVDNLEGDLSGESPQWLMHTQGKVVMKDNSFVIEGAEGAGLQGVFITPEDVKIEYQTTETGGKIVATGGNQYFVVMTMYGDKAPSISVLNRLGLNSTVAVGKQKIRFIRDRVVFD